MCCVVSGGTGFEPSIFFVSSSAHKLYNMLSNNFFLILQNSTFGMFAECYLLRPQPKRPDTQVSSGIRLEIKPPLDLNPSVHLKRAQSSIEKTLWFFM